MPDEITIKPSQESNSNQHSSPLENPPVPLNMSNLVSICAGCVLVCFFLPWTHFLGSSVSGLDIQKLGDRHKLLWLIPLFSCITIVAGFIGQHQKIAAQVTGSLPFFALAYWLNQLGSDLIRALSVGAYGSLVCGLALFLLARRLK